MLVAQPLHPLLEQRETPLVLVFDALDQCVEPDVSDVLQLIISSVSQLPNIKVFLTTCLEWRLRSKYMDTKDANIFHLQNIEDLIVEQDISLHVDYHFSESKVKEALGVLHNSHWKPIAEDKDRLVKLSGKLFIYTSTTIKFILDEQDLDPAGQLASLLDFKSDSPSSLCQLDNLYLYVLQSAKPAQNASIVTEVVSRSIRRKLLLRQVPAPLEKCFEGLDH